VTLKNYRRTPDGGLEPAPAQAVDYRRRLRSRRWGAAGLENPEAEKTNPWIAVLAIVVISAGTFLLLVLGYASGFWE
jgi:hypothetical protein